MSNNLIEEYWVNKEDDKVFECPNVSFFRFLGKLVSSLQDKLVLEIGFNNGSDLMECKRRGASIYGLDINPYVINKFKNILKNKVKVFRAGIDKIDLNKEFDLIYTRDTINYLTTKEIDFFFCDVFPNLKDNAILIVHFIENDLKLRNKDPLEALNFDLFKEGINKPIFEKNNPIRFIPSKEIIISAEKYGLNLIAKKRVIHSFDLQENEFRIERYLAFRK